MGKKKPKEKFKVSTPREPTHKGRVPEVIVFEEPGRKTGLKRQENSVNSKHTTSPVIPTTYKTFSHNEDDNSEPDFCRVAREVRDFGSTGLWKGDRKRYEKDKLLRLGAHKTKCKLPYPVAIKRNQKKKEKEEIEREKNKAMGVIRKRTQKDDRKRRKLRQHFGRWIDKAPDLDRTNVNLKKVNLKKLKKGLP